MRGSLHLKNYRVAMDLAEKMIQMADHNETQCEDDGNLLINAVIRDCGYKIRDVAEREYRLLKRSEDASPNEPIGSLDLDRDDGITPSR